MGASYGGKVEKERQKCSPDYVCKKINTVHLQNGKENNDENLLPYMIHCTRSKKRPEELHEPA